MVYHVYTRYSMLSVACKSTSFLTMLVGYINSEVFLTPTSRLSMHRTIEMSVSLFLILVCSEAILSSLHAFSNESKQDHYVMPKGLEDGEYNTEEPSQGLIENDFCSDLWFTPRNGTCHCGSTVHGAVTCNEQTKEVMVLDCYCMTTDSTNQTVVGACFYNCMNSSHTLQYIYNQAPSDCAHLHRRGTLCGECETDHFPLAYSYNMECIKCTNPDS